jgi:hypothetical protein
MAQSATLSLPLGLRALRLFPSFCDLLLSFALGASSGPGMPDVNSLDILRRRMVLRPCESLLEANGPQEQYLMVE